MAPRCPCWWQWTLMPRCSHRGLLSVSGSCSLEDNCSCTKVMLANQQQRTCNEAVFCGCTPAIPCGRRAAATLCCNRNSHVSLQQAPAGQASRLACLILHYPGPALLQVLIPWHLVLSITPPWASGWSMSPCGRRLAASACWPPCTRLPSGCRPGWGSSRGRCCPGGQWRHSR